MPFSAIKRLFSTGSRTNDGVNNNNNTNISPSWSDGIPDSIMESIFDQLDGKDLKNCREVCKMWSILGIPMLTVKTCVVYDCSQKKTNLACCSSTRTSKRLVKFLSSSELGFNGWTEMRVKSLTSGGMFIFLKRLPKELQFRSLQNITSLEISNSSLKWGNLTAFLRLFENLKVYKDIMNDNYMGDLSYLLCGDRQNATEYIEEKFGGKPFSITSLSITKKETNSNLNMLLRMMLRTVKELESFELKLHNNDFGWIATNDRTEFVTILGFFILKQSRTLLDLSLSWYCARSNFYFEDFLMCLGIVFAGELQLTTLNLHFEWIDLLHDDVEQVFIPFINRFTNLKKLSIAKILLHPQSAHRLQQLRPSNSPSCECDFSIVFSDHSTLDSHHQVLNILEGSPVMINCVNAIRIIISETTTYELSQLITIEHNTVAYLHTKELLVNVTYFPLGTDFRRFNMSLIVLSFPNLTTLWILDGPRFIYKGSVNVSRQWDKMSPASIGDVDMQLIIDELPNLKSLRLRIKMSPLTDCGLTGIRPEARKRIISNNAISKDVECLDPCKDFSGSPISNLRNLQEIMLKGLGREITDISIYLAFTDVPNLKTIQLYGSTRITRAGKRYIAKMFPKSKGFSVLNNF